MIREVVIEGNYGRKDEVLILVLFAFHWLTDFSTGLADSLHFWGSCWCFGRVWGSRRLSRSIIALSYLNPIRKVQVHPTKLRNKLCLTHAPFHCVNASQPSEQLPSQSSIWTARRWLYNPVCSTLLNYLLSCLQTFPLCSILPEIVASPCRSLSRHCSY